MNDLFEPFDAEMARLRRMEKRLRELVQAHERAKPRRMWQRVEAYLIAQLRAILEDRK